MTLYGCWVVDDLLRPALSDVLFCDVGVCFVCQGAESNTPSLFVGFACVLFLSFEEDVIVCLICC